MRTYSVCGYIPLCAAEIVECKRVSLLLIMKLKKKTDWVVGLVNKRTYCAITMI